MRDRPSTAAGDPARSEIDERAAALFERLPDEEARAELVRLYHPLAEYLARRFAGRGEPLDDLTQVASLGLIKAIDRFDPSRGVKFSTYASATIVGELKRHFRDTGWDVHVPRRLQETGLQVNRTIEDLSQSLGRSPTVPEIAKAAGLTEDEVVEGIEIAGAYSASSLDAPSDEGSGGVPEPAFEEETYELLEAWAGVADRIRELPERERHILYLRFFGNRTQTRIAEEIGISQMHVSRLLARTLAQLREAAAPGEGAAAP